MLLLLYLTFFSSHPIFLCLILVVFARVIGLAINLFVRQWLMIRVLLVFLGGMIVIFLYCSFISNEDKLVFNFFEFFQRFFIFFFWVGLIGNPGVLLKLESFNVSVFSQNLNLQLIFFLLFYLLFRLLVAVIFTISFKGAINKFGI